MTSTHPNSISRCHSLLSTPPKSTASLRPTPPQLVSCSLGFSLPPPAGTSRAALSPTFFLPHSASLLRSPARPYRLLPTSSKATSSSLMLHLLADPRVLSPHAISQARSSDGSPMILGTTVSSSKCPGTYSITPRTIEVEHPTNHSGGVKLSCQLVHWVTVNLSNRGVPTTPSVSRTPCSMRTATLSYTC
jgi:hypothetical protein